VPYITPWAVVRKPVPDAALRLFCFPHAGGAASAYGSWAADLAPEIEIVAVQPPGREKRIGEPPIDRMEPFLESAYQALRPLWNAPFAFFGHSTGALVGYELARRLRRDAGPAPVHLIATGRWAPHRHDPEPPVYALPDDALIAALRRYGGTPEEVLENRDLMEFLLPLLRADFAIGDTYRHGPETPLELPITAIGGESDPRVSREALEAWGEHTTGPFEALMLPGDHFFLHADRSPILALVERALRPALLAR
jgi:medium-chain acyl-[acyl-carrier-protein] hydrolase